MHQYLNMSRSLHVCRDLVREGQGCLLRSNKNQGHNSMQQFGKVCEKLTKCIDRKNTL